MIDECQGIDKLEKLQEHKQQSVYEAAVEIIEKFFSEPVSTYNASIMITSPKHFERGKVTMRG